eukprot:Em0338g4a
MLAAAIVNSAPLQRRKAYLSNSVSFNGTQPLSSLNPDIKRRSLHLERVAARLLSWQQDSSADPDGFGKGLFEDVYCVGVVRFRRLFRGCSSSTSHCTGEPHLSPDSSHAPPPGACAGEEVNPDLVSVYADRMCAVMHAFATVCTTLQRASGSSGLLPRFLDFINKYEAVLKVLLARNPQLIFAHFHFLLEDTELLTHFMHIVHTQPFEDRKKWFYENLYNGNEPSTELTLAAENAALPCGESSCSKIADAPVEMLKTSFSVPFAGEAGMGAGVRREWFDSLSKDILNPDYALFTQSVDGSTFQFNSHSGVNPDHLSYFRFAGHLMGLAIYHQQLLSVYFTRSFYKHILGVPVDYRDVESVDPEYANNLQWLLDHEIDNLGLELTFSIESDAFGAATMVELIEGGSQIPVTDQNKELLISGLPDINVDDWKANTEYSSGYDKDTAVIQWFWELVYCFRQERACNTPAVCNWKNLEFFILLFPYKFSNEDEDTSDQDLLVVERKTFKSLCSGLVQQCGCLSNPSWTISFFIKRGHVARVQFVCSHCKQCSRVLSGHYLANQKLVHAFTCAGMLPRQYMNFTLFAGMGVVKQKYISSVYLNKLYQHLMADVAEESMKAAVERVKESPHHATSGEWVSSDALHDSTSNAYHSTVPCLAGRQQHRVAQTREVACTKIVLPQVIARALNITEVAHDYQATIKQYVQQLGMVNSYDTWHGTKNVAKQLRHICAGTVRTRDRTWFTELSDKGMYFLDILIKNGLFSKVNMSQKTVLVFGGSGTVGQGVIRVLLENACRVVAVFRSVESEEKAKRRLGNPPENALITVIGALDSEEDAAMLKANVCKAGEITDVVASIGGWWQKGPVLEQSLDEYNKVHKDGLQSHFIAAKTFLPLIADKEGTSYTFITVPNAGFITMFAGALMKLVSVVQAEYHTKPVRVNEFCIGCYVQPWDAVTSGSVSNLDMGRAIAGVVIHPSTRGASLQVGANNMEKLATSGSL